MGFAYLIALTAVCVTGGLWIRDKWRAYKQADLEWQLSRSDERYARTHRIEL